ncbi:protein LplC [Thermoclostridium stercorarium subsp. stercorarium DSM 8532]|jgi:putative aldouronate transport system permease protein|uniref:Protein LplC n=3 Tax=Thermoclostridium stercorarium TaxID=1510 RepID=L7VL85_THES1|nr:carbohydrate ABC transporter permease [Thermoclostridium stercorarium]AGC67236.1 protein LplC [Thermoclostridium stercorarium subsp. stercorarium DSM 8532]AGI38307.1 ABC transporter periplasmic subunit-2 [Thermoclostridium stercorarium subsp. stercorarium DSM 8532]ANW97744.1 sugar ABC transporter permease [Thermoclostridium stercorarium subsp. thermolacticum DSM 2910]ANX00271.1 sugar ABC transporter permease [Thermoclostridium stercorarium subsp. leptospartum DSM 9219]UZQ85817.1 carbohydrat
MLHTGVKTKKTLGDNLFDTFNIIFWIIVLIIVIYPLWFILIASVSDPDAVMSGKVILWPKDFSLIGYEAVFGHKELLRSYMNSIYYTVVGTALSVAVTMMAAYALSRKFAGRKFVNFLFVFTMFFSGGLIPQFIMNRRLGLYDTRLLMIVINCVSVWNLMVARTYITMNIPNELYEAAIIDGASHFKYFIHAVLPLSGTIIAVLSVYYGVARWNDYFTALVYIRDRSKLPLQTILREAVATLTASTATDAFFSAYEGDVKGMTEAIRKALVAKYCAIVISTVPAVVLYILMQNYFVKGVMLGSLKG